MKDITRLDANARMSKVVIHGGLVYLCGQTSNGKKISDVTGQTTEVLNRVDALLTQAGTSRDRVLTTLIHLKSMDDFSAMNAVWEAWVPAGAAPARTTVQASMAHEDLLVEMTVVAAA